MPQGTVTVARVPVVAEGDDTELTATSTTFGERCAELDDGEPAEVVDWFGLNIAGCAVDGSSPAGTDVLVDVVVRLGVIAEIPITSDEAVPEETVRSALADLAVAATREL